MTEGNRCALEIINLLKLIGLPVKLRFTIKKITIETNDKEFIKNFKDTIDQQLEVDVIESMSEINLFLIEKKYIDKITKKTPWISINYEYLNSLSNNKHEDTELIMNTQPCRYDDVHCIKKNKNYNRLLRK